MVTIEKRADFYEKRCVEQANALGWCELPRPSQSYIVGAKEQREIDIKKACKWLQDNLEIPEDGVISEEDGKKLLGDNPLTFIEEFKRAMEEE